METRLKQLPIGAFVLYGLTLACEFPAVCVRFFVIIMLAAFISFFTAGLGALLAAFVVMAYWPMVWSVIALVPTIGHLGEAWAWRTRVGGREPSERERAAYEDAIEELQQHSSSPLPLPKDWFVIDEPELNAAVCGRTLMITRGMLENPYLPAVLAHELGHLNGWDSRITAALNRLVIQRWPQLTTRGEEGPSTMPIFLGAMWLLGPVLVLVVWLTRKAYTSCRGGLGLWLMKPLWGQVWRQGEYQADQYAASLGKADELAQFLQTHALAMDRPMPYPWLSDYTHPPVEHRIERLLTNAVTTTRPALERARSAIQDELPGFGVQTA